MKIKGCVDKVLVLCLVVGRRGGRWILIVFSLFFKNVVVLVVWLDVLFGYGLCVISIKIRYFFYILVYLGIKSFC